MGLYHLVIIGEQLLNEAHQSLDIYSIVRAIVGWECVENSTWPVVIELSLKQLIILMFKL